MRAVLKVESEKICFVLFVEGCSEIHELARENIYFVFFVYLNIQFLILTHVLNAEINWPQKPSKIHRDQLAPETPKDPLGYVQLENLQNHVEQCGFAPVTCGNEGCGTVVNKRDKEIHERELCQFRIPKCHDCRDIKASQDEMKGSQDEMKVSQYQIKVKTRFLYRQIIGNSYIGLLLRPLGFSPLHGWLQYFILRGYFG